jgi:hypothetical protein
MIKLKDILLNEVSLVTPQSEEPHKKNKIREILQRKCPVALKQFQSGVKIFRGVDANDMPWMYVNPLRTTRQSANTSNHYTLMIDNNPKWKKFPKRSKSIIATGSRTTARGYGGMTGIYNVFPMGDPLIGICPWDDFWESFKKSLEWFGDGQIETMNDFNAAIGKLGEAFLVDVSDDSFESFTHSLNEIGLIIQNTPPDEIERIKYKIMNQGNVGVNRMITYLQKSEKGLLEMFMNLFTPQRNGFQLKRLSQLSASDFAGSEVWLSAPSVLVDTGELGELV